MACDRCRDLCVVYAIGSPHDLRVAINLVGESVAEGLLLQTPGSSQAMFAPVPIHELRDAKSWPDVLVYNFTCSNCGQEFVLQAETYHGAGGSWQPKNPNGPGAA